MASSFSCNYCGESFRRRSDLVIHYRDHAPHPRIARPEIRRLTCIHCGRGFDNRAELVRHYHDHPPHPRLSRPDRRRFAYRRPEVKNTFTCVYCGEVFPTREDHYAHVNVCKATLRPECAAFEEELNRNLDGRIRCELVQHDSHRQYGREVHCTDPSHALQLVRQPLERLLSICVNELTNCKFQLGLTITLSKGEKIQRGGFWSFFSPCYNVSDIPTVLDEAYVKIKESIDAYAERGSGWTIVEVESMTVKVAKIKPIRSSSYIPLPKGLRKKSSAIVNIKNRDNKCFLYSVLAGKMSSSETNVDFYTPFLDTVDYSMLNFPTPLSEIAKFERVNNLSINVISFSNKDGLYPLVVSKNQDGDTVDLLFISDENGNKHYCCIRDIDQLLRFRGTGTNVKYYCRNCFGAYGKESLLKTHKCVNRAQSLTFRGPGKNILKFNQFERRNAHPWIIYADFECMLLPVHTARSDPSTSSSTQLSLHSPVSFGYVIIGPHGELVDEVFYFGTDAVDVFHDRIQGEMSKFASMKLQPLKMQPEDEVQFRASSTCFYCGRTLDPSDKVRDHCHFTGKYRGPAHGQCNLRAGAIRTIPVVFHNLEGYDGHLLISASKKFPDNVSVIARNSERFASMTITKRFKDSFGTFSVKLRFIDSLNFLSSSLENLVNNHKKDGRPFSITEMALSTKDWFTADAETVVNLMKQKGHYPYEYVDSVDVFEEKELPPKEAFHSSVRGSDLTDDEYRHATTVWNLLKNKVFLSYHEVYQMVDVYLLADVFETFRKTCLENDNMDPCYYISTAGFSWAAALKKTEAALELFTHVGKHNFIASGIRGGLSFIAKRRSIANNKYLPETYDPTRPDVYLIDLDINNLYGLAMTEYLPYDQFRWLKKEEILSFDLFSVKEDAEFGYILEVDLDYPATLHREHGDYPLAPERLEISPDFVSPFMKTMARDRITPTTKLTTNLLPKRNYVVHYRNLQFYVEHGLVMKGIRRILTFRQKQWLKPYIEFNTEKRQTASSSIERDFFKLKNNAVFGKTLEDKSNRMSVKLSTDTQKTIKYSSLPHAKSFKILNESLVQVDLKVCNVICDLPTYTGFTILDLSKLTMYKFHYNFMRKKYGDRAKLLFTDTDSLVYEVKTEDLYRDMKFEIDHFDTSNYDPAHFLYNTNNSLKLGKMKDETGGIPIKEFVGLKAKMYSVSVGDDGIRRAKGICKSFVQRSINHEDYVKALVNAAPPPKAAWTTIRSKDHSISTVEICKSSISPYDDKRFVLGDGVETLPHGHFETGINHEVNDTPIILVEDEEEEERTVVEESVEAPKKRKRSESESKKSRLQKKVESEKQRRDDEDPVRRKERLEKEAARKRETRAKEDGERKKERLKKEVARDRKRRADENPEQRKERLEKQAARNRKRRAKEDVERR